MSRLSREAGSVGKQGVLEVVNACASFCNFQTDLVLSCP